MTTDRRPSSAPLILLFTAVVMLVGWTLFRNGFNTASSERLVVYCAHDSVYAEPILRQFELATGMRVDVRFDTEATKSLGLVRQLIQEAADPRCDVFWNNELLGTMELKEQGLLETYRGKAWERLPATFRDPDGQWVGFGGRLRVYVINPDKMPVSEAAMELSLAANSLAEMAIARPMFGTTLTQYSLQWQQWGPERQKAWHDDLHRRGVIEATGNGMVKNLIAAGTCGFGLTDTDDVFVAKDDGYNVAMLPVRVEGKTICIPNTAAIVRGTKNLSAAQRLIDYLASAETELALANSKSRQVPLGPVAAEQVPRDVRPLVEWAQDAADLSGLLPARRACLEWLREAE